MTLCTKVQNNPQIETVARLAKIIWTEHFNEMIGPEAVAYMIETFQSKPAIIKQIKEQGYTYYLIQPGQKAIGYAGICLNKEKDELFVSKLYLLSSQRGKGYGKQVMQFLENMARKHQVSKISLTVYHKNTTAIQAYKKMGFRHTGSIKRDIGKNIIIHDYTMEKQILSEESIK